MKSFLTVRFPKSASRNYKTAISLAEQFSSFTPNDGKGKLNSVRITKEDFRSRHGNVETLWSVVRGWKGSALLLERSQIEYREFRQIAAVVECGKKYSTAVIQEDHCKLYGDKDGWSCKFLDTLDRYLPSSPYDFERQRYWFQFGKFVSPMVWKIDKGAILKTLKREAKLKKLDLCPVFDLKKVKTAVDELPNTIDVKESDVWQIQYEEGSDGTILEQKPVCVVPKKFEGERGFRFTYSVGLEGESEDQKEELPKHRFIPPISFADIGGIDDILQTIREVIELPLKQPELFQFLKVKPHKGILLYGTPGCGKTLVAKAIANEVQAHFISVKGPELRSKWHGQSEENLRKLFHEARELQPSIIFFDEIDSIAQKRSGDEAARLDAPFVNQLLTLMDGIEDYGNVRVIASTNRPELLDDALLRPGRFDYKIEVLKPTRQGCKRIFEIHTRGMPISKDFHRGEFAKQLEGLTGAQIAFVAREGAYNCLRRSLDVKSLIAADAGVEIDYGKLSITSEDFAKALRRVEDV